MLPSTHTMYTSVCKTRSQIDEAPHTYQSPPLSYRHRRPIGISRGGSTIPGHALHEKGLQRQTGVGPLVSSQERRAAVVPLINRLSTAGKPPVNRGLVPPPLSIGFRLFVLLGRRSGHLFSMPWRVRRTVVCWANRFVGVPSCPAPPRRPPCAAPTRLARGMSGFWVRQV